MIGKKINNYIIERKLGDGGMGEVYYARHNKVDREVAIKILHSYLFQNENIHNRFKNEANALIKLTHPNIVKIYDYVEQENLACLIMEYIDGYTLDVYISKLSGPLPSERAINIMSAVLDAVQYAHDCNVYHRDIKPANIMIGKDGGKVRIMDFGIAKLTDSKNFKTTHANTQLGTPFYMSPEQIKGLPFTRRSDIYSLGVTLFEMVTGKCPYHDINSLFELQSKIVNEPLPLTSQYYPGVSLSIQNAINKSTSKNPEARFSSCNEFKKYLQSFDSTVIIQSPVIKGTPIKQSGKSNYLTFILIGVALVTLLSIFILLINNNLQSRIQNSQTKSQVTAIDSIADTAKPAPKDTMPDHSIIDENNKKLTNYLKAKGRLGFTIKKEDVDEISNKIQVYKSAITQNELAKIVDPHIYAKPKAVPAIPLPSKDNATDEFWKIISSKRNKALFGIVYTEQDLIVITNMNIDQVRNRNVEVRYVTKYYIIHK